MRSKRLGVYCRVTGLLKLERRLSDDRWLVVSLLVWYTVLALVGRFLRYQTTNNGKNTNCCFETGSNSTSFCLSKYFFRSFNIWHFGNASFMSIVCYFVCRVHRAISRDDSVLIHPCLVRSFWERTCALRFLHIFIISSSSFLSRQCISSTYCNTLWENRLILWHFWVFC